MPQPQQDDYYEGGARGTAFSFADKHSPGCWVNKWRGGLVVSVKKQQAMNQADGKPKFWKDKNGSFTDRAIGVRIITVYCPDEKDPANPADTGLRSHWIEDGGLKYGDKHPTKAGQPREGSKFFQYDAAMIKAGKHGFLPEPGGYFYQCQTGARPGQGDIDEKTWVFEYRTPTTESLAELSRILGTLGIGDDLPEGPPAAPVSPFQGNGQAPAPPVPTTAPASPQSPAAPASVPAPPTTPVRDSVNASQITGYDPATGKPIYATAPAPPAPAAASNGTAQIIGYSPTTGEPIYAPAAAAPVAVPAVVPAPPNPYTQ